MLGGRQTIFLIPYFQFEKRFDFLFVYVMNRYVRLFETETELHRGTHQEVLPYIILLNKC